MGRECRRVPPFWVHPKDKRGNHIPLLDGFNKRLLDWCEGEKNWKEGFYIDFDDKKVPLDNEQKDMRYSDWAGKKPDPKDYMPDWDEEQRTHYQMYEDTSEGTPISPVFDSAEKLARWLSDTGASSFGDRTASYDAWLNVCREGWVPSAVVVCSEEKKYMLSGVEHTLMEKKESTKKSKEESTKSTKKEK